MTTNGRPPGLHSDMEVTNVITSACTCRLGKWNLILYHDLERVVNFTFTRAEMSVIYNLHHRIKHSSIVTIRCITRCFHNDNYCHTKPVSVPQIVSLQQLKVTYASSTELFICCPATFHSMATPLKQYQCCVRSVLKYIVLERSTGPKLY